MADWIPYFAFGANLNKDVFYGTRKMQPKSWERAQLHGFQVRFTEPGVMPLLEPAFASIEACEGGVVHGVLYYINHSDFERLNLSESHNYSRLDMEVIGEESGSVVAKVYKSRYTKEGLKPSTRYRDVIVQGARDHGLPDDYCQMLEAHDASYVPMISDIFWAGIKPYMKLREMGVRHEVLFEWYRRRKR